MTLKLYNFYCDKMLENGVCSDFTALASSKDQAWKMFEKKMKNQLGSYDPFFEHWTVKELPLNESFVLPHYNYNY